MLGKNKDSLRGFTLVELLVTISIISITMAIAIPNLSEFIVKLRVNNEISNLHRLLLTARNTAITSELAVTICPLGNGNVCTDDWENEITVFTDIDNDGIYEPAANERIIKVKDAAQTGDKLQYSQSRLTYVATGSLSGATASGPRFSYCPYSHSTLSRGILVSASGRAYVTADIDGDNKDEDRNGNEIACS